MEGFNGFYAVSNHGEVKSLARCYQGGLGKQICMLDRIMAPQKHYKGYRFVTLRREGVRRKEFIHRLVACAFLDNPEAKPYVNHLDRDKTNNNLANLEWATEQENSDHWVQHEARMKAFSSVLDTQTFAPEDLPF